MRPEDRKKDILIPVFCCEYSTAEDGINSTPEDLLRMARDDSDSPIEMEYFLDGVDLKPHYVETGPFNISVPSNHLLTNENADPGTHTAVTVGYWHLLKPLPPGKHKLRFGGINKQGFHTKIECIVNVPSIEKQ